jgi:hypothetical protein
MTGERLGWGGVGLGLNCGRWEAAEAEAVLGGETSPAKPTKKHRVTPLPPQRRLGAVLREAGKAHGTSQPSNRHFQRAPAPKLEYL